MKIQSVFERSFSVYGQIILGYDFSKIIKVLNTLPTPENAIEYLASYEAFERLVVFQELQDRQFGGMPIQIGYCTGTNTKLTCFEYHRDSEVNIYATDSILLLGRQQDIIEGKYETTKVEAFLAPAGSAVELYATTLHYAPCDAKNGAGFRAAVVLSKGTNTDKPACEIRNLEDKSLFAKNKWLLALPGSVEAEQGAYVGLTGYNIDISERNSYDSI